jgi:hypothetical protein
MHAFKLNLIIVLGLFNLADSSPDYMMSSSKMIKERRIEQNA